MSAQAIHTAANSPASCPSDGHHHVSQKPPAHIPAKGGRICFIGANLYGLLYPSSGLEFGGAEVQLLTLAKALVRHQGMQVSVLAGDGRETRRDAVDGVAVALSPHIGQHLRPAVPRLETAWDRFQGRLRSTLDRIPLWAASTVRGLVRSAYALRRGLVVLPLRAFHRWLVSFPSMAALVLVLRRRQYVRAWEDVLKTVPADIVVMRCAGSDVGYIQRACRRLHRKFVYMVAHEIDVSGEYGRTTEGDGWLFEQGLRKADMIICQHHEQVDLLRARYRKEGRVIRSICPLPVSTGVRQAERRIVLWVARLEQWKRPELLVDLARRLPGESFVMVAPPTRLDRDYSARIEAEVAALPNLRLVPGVPFSEITALFEDAKVFVNTSHYEGFPNTFLQAAACGTPIVSWVVNPEGMLERHRIGYCAEQDQAKFEALVRQLCETPALGEELGENGRQYVSRYHSPAAIAQEYAGLFAQLMPPAPARNDA
jgi:glycosyltransferase involved in cell wall biosynthesis